MVQLTVCDEHDVADAEHVLPLVDTVPLAQVAVVEPVTLPVESVTVVLLPLDPPG